MSPKVRICMDPRRTSNGMQSLLEAYTAYLTTDDVDYQECLADIFWATVTAYQCDDEAAFDRSVLKYRDFVQRRFAR